ncbi:hypothetical protein [Paraburkholderia megapolitana]|uniref:hypothetical protein n=1 Tax=Paraburkholderia megapolitana TaxID=420953 RepID=UPI0038B765C5
MLIITMLLRRIAGRLSAVPRTSGRLPRDSSTSNHVPAPLYWRTPWLRWHLLSWITLTLLAPPFWAIGILLTINPHSDQPWFWPATMAIVPLANGLTILLTNQRHHRARFTSRRDVTLYYFAVSMPMCCALFTLVLWATNAITGLVGPLAVGTHGTPSTVIALWAAGLIAGVGISSSAHASILHAWLAFEA